MHPQQSPSTRIAILSDIHSNLEALTAVLDDVQAQGITSIVCLGDIVGYAADPLACLNKIRELGCPVVLGNHDEAAWMRDPSVFFNDTARAGAYYSAQQIRDSDKEWLRSLPRDLTIGESTFLHSSLDYPEDWNYIISTKDAEAHFARQISRVAFCGHTHDPLLWSTHPHPKQPSHSRGKGTMPLPKEGKTLVNVGSVGQPRDGDNRACYVVHHPEMDTVEFRRVIYPIEATQAKIHRAGLPRFTAERLSHGR